LTPLRLCTRTCRGTRLSRALPRLNLAAASAASHHAGQDRAVLVIVKPRRWRSDRAFRTASGFHPTAHACAVGTSGLTMPARGAEISHLRDGRQVRYPMDEFDERFDRRYSVALSPVL
jgi:hypothetical protein